MIDVPENDQYNLKNQTDCDPKVKSTFVEFFVFMWHHRHWPGNADLFPAVACNFWRWQTTTGNTSAFQGYIAAILQNTGKRFLTGLSYLCHPTSPLALCNVNFSGLGGNNLSILRCYETITWTMVGSWFETDLVDLIIRIWRPSSTSGADLGGGCRGCGTPPPPPLR